jgi:malate synthase
MTLSAGVAPIPPGLENRRIEITGPVERKMIINANTRDPYSSSFTHVLPSELQ